MAGKVGGRDVPFGLGGKSRGPDWRRDWVLGNEEAGSVAEGVEIVGGVMVHDAPKIATGKAPLVEGGPRVFAEIRRVLRPGGWSLVAMSHRCFPTKAVRAFHSLSGEGRCQLVSQYHSAAKGFDEIVASDRSPTTADPLWMVAARKAEVS